MNTTAMYGSAAASGISAIGQVAGMVQQYNMAKAMLEHKGRMANSDFDFQMKRFGNAEELMSDVEGITTNKNEVLHENAKAHSAKDIATARLLEQKKTEKASRVKNRTVLKGIMNRRGTPFYGSPATTT